MKHLALVLLLLPMPSLALDGSTLVAWCSNAAESAPGVDVMTFEYGYCAGWTEGVIALATRDSAKKFCPPEPIGKLMLIRTVLGYLREHPERLKQPAEILAPEALSAMYPCPIMAEPEDAATP
jgi:hypothetical protein